MWLIKGAFFCKKNFDVSIFMFKVASTENMKDCLVLFVYRREPCDTINEM